MKKLMLTAAACAAMAFGAKAEFSVDELTKDLPEGWGYATKGLGAKGDEVALVFTNTAPSKAMTFALPDFVHEVRYLVVGGGGAGGSSGNAYGGGGGGAGGVVQSETPLILAGGETVTAVVGAGSPKVSGNTHGGNGNKSTLTIDDNTFTAYRGGGGANGNADGYGNSATSSQPIASGGGAGGPYAVKKGGAGNVSNGGDAKDLCGGGGGGAGGNGYHSWGDETGANKGVGGDGVATVIFDGEIRIAGGGSGSGSARALNPSVDGGGAGGYKDANGGANATSGSTWGAGGGGAKGANCTSGAGHQGVVVVRFSTTASSTVPVVVPVIASKVYTGETLTADIADTDEYEVVANAGGVNAGTYDVVLHLKDHEPAYAWQDDGSTEDRTLPFEIERAQDGWLVAPSLSKLAWGDNEDPATVVPGEAKSGSEVKVTYDDGAKDMPLTRGPHTAVFTVVESQNYTVLSEEIAYTVLKHVNSWTKAPNVPATVNIEDGANFTTPVPAHGTLVCYYDGNPETREAPLTLGKHTVTYFVKGDDVDWEDFEQTYGYEVTYKPVVDPTDSSIVYGYRLPGLGTGGNEVAVVFTNTTAGTMTFALPKYVEEISYLVVGGGASGGRSASAHGAGGGGAGGVVTNEGPYAVEGGSTLAIVVGAGGAKVTADGNNGNSGHSSSLTIADKTFDALKGGYGGCYTVNGNGEGGLEVACGGGAGGYNGNTRTGGDGVTSDGATVTGGGGGGGGAGGDADGVKGGVGVPVTIFDDTEYYIAGGGAGSGRKASSLGGLGGGGNGGTKNGTYWNEAATSGSRWGAGGGGTEGSGCYPSGAGYQGVVVVRYAEQANAAILPTIPAVMYSGETQVAKPVGGTGFTVVANEGGVDAGTYDVVIALADGYAVWEDGVTDEQRTLDFVIEKSDHNEWNPEPSISKSTWTVGDENPGVLTAGRTTFGPVTATYTRNGEEQGEFDGTLPTAAGAYVITYVAPDETDNYVTVAEEDKVKTVEFSIVMANAVAKVGDYDTYETVADAFAAAKDGDVITILQSTTVDGKIDVTNSVKLVLAGYALTVGAEGQGTLFQVKGGATLTIDGTEEGSTLNGSVYVGAKDNDNCTLVIDGGTYNCAKVVSGVVVNPYANCAIQSNGLCGNITITATGATFNSADDTFYLAAGGTYTLEDCVVNGATGIYMKGGTLNLTGTTITATGAFADPLPNGNGANSTGDGIIVDAKLGYSGKVTLNLGEGNVVTSASGYAIRETYTDAEATAVHAISVTGGTFAGAKGTFVASAFFDAALEAGTATCAFEKASYTKPLDAKYIAAGHLQKKLEDGTYCIGPAADTEALTYTWNGNGDTNLWQAANWSINKDLAPDAYVGFPNTYGLATAKFAGGDEPIEVKLAADVSVKCLTHAANTPALTIDLDGHTLKHNMSESSHGGGVGWQYFTLRAQSGRGALIFKNGAFVLPSGNSSTGELLLDANSHVYFDNVSMPTSGKNFGATYQHKDVAVTFQNGCNVAGLSCYGGKDFLLEVDDSTVTIDPTFSRSDNARLIVRNGGTLKTSEGAFSYEGNNVTIQVEGEGSSANLAQSTYGLNGFTAKNWTLAALDGAEVSLKNIVHTFTSDPSDYDIGTRFSVSNASFKATGSVPFHFGIHTTDASCVSPTIALAGTNATFHVNEALLFGTDAMLANPPMFELNPAANGLKKPCITSGKDSITIGSNVCVKVVTSGILASGGAKAKVTLARVKASGTLSVDVGALAANTTVVDAAGEPDGDFVVKYALKDAMVGDVEYKDLVVTISRGGFAVIVR